MRNWAKLFLTLHQEVIQEQLNKKQVRQVEMIGYALLKKDSLTGKKYWISWAGKGDNEVTFDEGSPLVFPPDTLQIGTRVHLLPPKE